MSPTHLRLAHYSVADALVDSHGLQNYLKGDLNWWRERDREQRSRTWLLMDAEFKVHRKTFEYCLKGK